MEARAVKMANSLAFLIPKPIVAKLGLMENTSVDISLRGDEIVFRPMPRKYILSELLAGITPENMHDEVGWGEPMGQELLWDASQTNPLKPSSVY
ncbi:AbrB/MazE/SpoVT family DNA-binding domain-containing protein [Desulfonatronum thiodismutans]|uniref:AbrB/MazE/SpoVT family DNA-binding domain-containing protein n=1 Tax=Desulfonatronum thiodismutans TaxID=159290 RepID=UPI00068A4618|nr:MazF family transcriptional regulator [Desulfonatronum thiodismutans]